MAQVLIEEHIEYVLLHHIKMEVKLLMLEKDMYAFQEIIIMILKNI